jgi:hypothetical protein
MCLVIDANCFGLVFAKAKNGFTPIRTWIEQGDGCMIYGGTKYNRELRDGGALPFVAELSRGRKAANVPTDTVDQIAAQLKAKFPESKFNDEHIVALVVASRCCVVCSNDQTAIAYLKRVDVFADYAGVKRPKIFKGHRDHIKMCCDDHVVEFCRKAQA